MEGAQAGLETCLSSFHVEISSSSSGSESGAGWIKTLKVKSKTTGQDSALFVQLITQDGKMAHLADLQRLSCYSEWRDNRLLDMDMDKEDFKDQLGTVRSQSSY